jgi:hypothetical protein
MSKLWRRGLYLKEGYDRVRLRLPTSCPPPRCASRLRPKGILKPNTLTKLGIICLRAHPFTTREKRKPGKASGSTLPIPYLINNKRRFLKLLSKRLSLRPISACKPRPSQRIQANPLKNLSLSQYVKTNKRERSCVIFRTTA